MRDPAGLLSLLLSHLLAAYATLVEPILGIRVHGNRERRVKRETRARINWAWLWILAAGGFRAGVRRSSGASLGVRCGVWARQPRARGAGLVTTSVERNVLVTSPSHTLEIVEP